MKKLILVTLVLASLALAISVPVFAASSTVTWVNEPAGGVIELAVGETYVAQFDVTSDAEFISATAMVDSQFPGRVFFARNARAGRGTEATLNVEFTGKKTTTNTTNNTVPASIVVGVRYGGGVVEVYEFPVEVVLTP